MAYPRDRLLWDRMYRLWLLSRAKASKRLRNAVQLGLF